MKESARIAVIGLGYVGYPLALAFGKYFDTRGFDINQSRIDELLNKVDRTREADLRMIDQAKNLSLGYDQSHIADANIYIITTSTPITASKKPDLSEVILAAETVGKSLSQGDTVVLESTVYPGATEGPFAEAIEKVSGLIAGKDFNLGFSPERINPGDPLHRLQDIIKVVSASDDETLECLYTIYSRIIPAGVHKAVSIKTAELSKLIENTQRDINIAFLNEMLQMSEALNLDFNNVLACAKTKWNFIDFIPGLVGGHCVAVDPYYLIHSQKKLGVPSHMTEAARGTNEQMIEFVSSSFVKLLTKSGLSLPQAKVLIIGATFKANCPDMRNSKANKVIEELLTYGISPDVYDPVANFSEYRGFTAHSQLPNTTFDAVLILVPHTQVIEELTSSSHQVLKSEGVFYSLDSSLKALVV